MHRSINIVHIMYLDTDCMLISDVNGVQGQIYQQIKQKSVELDTPLWVFSYCSSAAVVVKVHERPCVSDSPLFSVYEGFGKLDPVVDIVTTAPPVELSSVITGSSALVWVTVTRLQLALAAGASECVHHPCWGNGVDERCLATAWERETRRESTKRSNRYSMQHSILSD